MKELLANMKDSWETLAKAGIFIAGIATVIIVAPPIDNFNSNTIKFLVTVLIGFLLVPSFLYKEKRHFKSWLILSLTTFFIAISLVVSYHYCMSKYVVSYQNQQVVVGNTFLPEALKSIEVLNKEDNQIYQNRSAQHDSVLLSYRGGDPQSIWEYKGINNNKILLVALFYLSISAITILMLCLIQTLQLLFLKPQ